MFTEAIEKATKYTKAIHIISRNYGSTIIQPGTATPFIVNSEGWLLTCSHVAGTLAAEKDIIKRAGAFMTELAKRKGTIKYNRFSMVYLRVRNLMAAAMNVTIKPIPVAIQTISGILTRRLVLVFVSVSNRGFSAICLLRLNPMFFLEVE